jgi:hypothetical protein
VDIVQRNKAWAKENAIEVVRRFEKEWMKFYREPSRKGVPKGDLIGMFEKKWRAVSYMVLHPPLSLKEVASLVDNVSYAQLRQWKIQDVFNKVSEKAAELFSKVLIENIESTLADTDFWHAPKNSEKFMVLAEILPFFNYSVSKRMASFLKKKLDETKDEDGKIWWAQFAHKSLQGARVKDFRGLQKWESDPANIDLLETSVDFWFRTLIYEHLEALFSDPATLSDPKIGKRYLSEINESFSIIKSQMFQVIYTLAGLQEKLDILTTKE